MSDGISFTSDRDGEYDVVTSKQHVAAFAPEGTEAALSGYEDLLTGQLRTALSRLAPLVAPVAGPLKLFTGTAGVPPATVAKRGWFFKQMTFTPPCGRDARGPSEELE